MRLFICSILLNFSLLSGQNVFDKKNEIGGVYLIINFFAKTINDYGHTDHLYKLKVDTEVEFLDLEKKFGNVAKGTIAIAYGTMNNSKTHLLIDIGYWSKLSTLEKFTTIFHEIVHDAFNVKHIEWDDKYNLMHPFIQPKSIDDLVIMTNRFFRDLDEGRLEYFEQGELYIHNNSLRSKTDTYNKSILIY